MKMSPNRRDLQRMAGWNAATSQTCSLAQMGSDPPEGPDSSMALSSSQHHPLGAAEMVGVIITRACTYPQDPREKGVKSMRGPPSQSQCLSFAKSPEDKVFREMLKSEPKFHPSFAPGLKLRGSAQLHVTSAPLQIQHPLQPWRLTRAPRASSCIRALQTQPCPASCSAPFPFLVRAKGTKL